MGDDYVGCGFIDCQHTTLQQQLRAEEAHLRCQLFLVGLRAHGWRVVPHDGDRLEQEGPGGIKSM